MTGTWSLVSCTSNSTYWAPRLAAAMKDGSVFSPSCRDLLEVRFLPSPLWPMSIVDDIFFQYVCRDVISMLGWWKGVMTT